MHHCKHGDPGTPNHLAHDSLGNPHTCTGNHNHPERGELCRDCGELHPFRCARCDNEIVGAKQLAGMLMVTISSPIMPDDSGPTVLCFNCGNALAHFLLPELKNDPEFMAAEAEAIKSGLISKE